MTHAGAHGFHPHQERVRVAVHAQLAHPQPVAALLPFTPKLLARTAVKGGFSGFECRRERSEEHTSELQSPCNLVCRLLLEKKKLTNPYRYPTVYRFRASDTHGVPHPYDSRHTLSNRSSTAYT